MDKVLLKPETMVNPVPVAMVSCGTAESGYNIITIAWTGIVNAEPPMAYIAVRKSRHSHAILEREKEFVINLCDEKLLPAADYCGVNSGRDVDKFKEAKLTAAPALLVRCPIIKEAPINVECKVKDILVYPSHDLFFAEIVQMHADETIIGKNGKIEMSKAGLICYNHWEYYGLTKEPIGTYGYTAKK